jgi:hypothetical protein
MTETSRIIATVWHAAGGLLLALVGLVQVVPLIFIVGSGARKKLRRFMAYVPHDERQEVDLMDELERLEEGRQAAVDDGPNR